MEEAWERGWERGWKIGVKRAKDEFALAMLAAGEFSVEEVAEFVEYPLEEVQRVKSELDSKG